MAIHTISSGMPKTNIALSALPKDVMNLTVWYLVKADISYFHLIFSRGAASAGCLYRDTFFLVRTPLKVSITIRTKIVSEVPFIAVSWSSRLNTSSAWVSKESQITSTSFSNLMFVCWAGNGRKNAFTFDYFFFNIVASITVSIKELISIAFRVYLMTGAIEEVSS